MNLRLLCLIGFISCITPAATCQTLRSPTTAWLNNHFVVQTSAVVSQSDIVLDRPNLLPSQAMPLGNGRLGVAVWSANGLTAQLNRVDSLPDRLSLGQVNLPGLTRLTSAKDYRGRLDLYNGDFVEHGAGLTAAVYVQPASDLLIIDVKGANPNQRQTATLSLWPPRNPHASVSGKLGLLAENWIDNTEPGASGRRFGTLAGLTAEGRDISVAVEGTRSVTLSLLPRPDGSFRILIPAPHFNGEQSPQVAAHQQLLHPDFSANKLWWNHFWHRTGLIKVKSADGAGQYMENLRDLYFFASAAESGGEYPGSQAGIADLFSAVRDAHLWDPAAFWHWNLRMQVAANLGAGLPDLNAPYFNLYRENLASIEAWTKQHMNARPGICVPETMRFNGVGVEYEAHGASPPTVDLDCDAKWKPYYNARTLSTGAEVSLWVWQQYLQTGDRNFLAKNYPLLQQSARFLLAYEHRGADGLMHTAPSNAHETQWDIVDPVTDLIARQSLYTETIQAATELHRDAELVAQLRTELKKIPALPRTQETPPLTVLNASADMQGRDMIADSWAPSAEQHNVENLGLEPVWPYGLIGDRSPLFALARRTYAHRPYPLNQDWSFDPIQAARLDLDTEVGSTLIKLTEKYQTFINGFANWGGDSGEFYIEQEGVVATALQQALVQDYDGTIRIAPALPPGWDFDGTVYVRGKTKVDVQTRSGRVTTAVIQAGQTQSLSVRNPWPGALIDVIDSASNTPIRARVLGPDIHFHAIAGHNYILRLSQASAPAFAPVTGTPAAGAKQLGPRQIGLASAPD
jgi:hypothetical protein